MSVDASAELPVVPARLPSVAKRWMAHPRTGRPFRSLDVVDIDLDTDRVTRQRSSASSNPAPEGVTAFVWLHGEPIGAFTTPGDPAVLSPSLPSLARAVLGRPAVLVLDDPLSALDVHTESLVEEALSRVLVRTTALVVAHRPSTVLLADRVAAMSG